MSIREKLLTKWLTHPPKLAPIHEVEGVIEWAVNELGFVITNRKGSHIKLFHDKLRDHDEFDGGLGSFDVCILGGQRVKGCYLELLSLAIDEVRKGK